MIETFPRMNSAEKTFYIAQVLKSKFNIINCILKNKIRIKKNISIRSVVAKAGQFYMGTVCGCYSEGRP